MIRDLEKYIGRTIEIIYIDKRGRITQRKVLILSIRNEKIKVFCLERSAPRVLRIENILALMPAKRYAV